MAPEVLLSKCSEEAERANAQAEKRLAARQNALMVKRIAPIRVVVFCLLASCAALCQNAPPKASVHQDSKVRATNAQRSLRATAKSLPDAPSVQGLNAAEKSEAEKLEGLAGQLHLPLLGVPAATTTSPANEIRTPAILPEAPPVMTLTRTVPEANQNKANAFLAKYFNPSAVRQGSRYQLSSSDNLIWRATDAASRIFILRDETGKRKLNTSYFLRVLTSVAADSASRRNRARSGTAPLSDFGSTVGNDAGMNLLREFGPGVRQTLTSHLPGFVFRVADHVNRRIIPRPAHSIPAK